MLCLLYYTEVDREREGKERKEPNTQQLAGKNKLTERCSESMNRCRNPTQVKLGNFRQAEQI